MKRIITLLCTVLFLQLSTLQAQSPEIPSAFSYSVAFFDYYSPSVDEWYNPDFTTVGAKIGYHRNLAGPLNLEVPIKIGSVKLPTPDNEFHDFDQEKWLTSLDGILQLQWYKPNFFIVPYITAGVGMNYVEDEDFDIQLPLGVGFDVKLFETFYLQARSEYRLASNDYRDTDLKQHNLVHLAGIKVLFGGEAREKEPEEPVDIDGDGVANADDACPTVAGPAELFGCPDSDGDGVADKDDLCPEVPGSLQYNGCADSDEDGIPDNQDDCPNEAGPTFNSGCPLNDADGDGIPDAEDLCPNQVGTTALGGCPDSDSDGVADNEDACPNAPGLAINNGCPDSDGDGVADNQDQCPTQPGTAANNGCPEVPEIEEEDRQTLEFAAQDIQFGSNSSYFERESYPILERVVEILNKYPDYNASIEGYTDNQGEAKYNQWLSERRAQRVYDYFVSKGIAADRLTYEGLGEENPISTNDTADGRELNRRVEINLYPGE